MADMTEYLKAQKLGQRAYRQALSKGAYPYLPALDEFLQHNDIQTEMPMGLMEIPLDQIAGTKTTGRQQAFACNFMPIMSEDSEFAVKWKNLFEYQLEEGVKDPIQCYEYMNKYYVLEGNKRVSVFKYLNAFSIEGYVTRIVPKMSSDPQVKIFYEYMEFFRRTGINYIWFSKEGSFAQLIRLCGRGIDEIWTDDQKEDFSSNYLRFQKLFEVLGGRKLSITPGDAFLRYIGIYPYDQMNDLPERMLRAQMEKLWREFGVIEEDPEKTLVMDPGQNTENTLFTRFFGSSNVKSLKVGFIHERPVEKSSWVYSHELGRNYVDTVFGDKLTTLSYCMNEGEYTDLSKQQALLEQAVADGCHIIFTTSERFLDTSLKCALAHPEVKVLNCCVNRPYGVMRTYSGRMYEAKFLEGMIAGAMADNNKIAYQADYPIYGAMANINAFALGAATTNPRARIYLSWHSVKNREELQVLAEREQIHVIADHDFVRPGAMNRRYGLYMLNDGHVTNLAAPIWNWGKFYEKMIRDILGGSWHAQANGRKAYNYFWGISGDIIDLVSSQKLPSGLKALVQMMRDQLYQNTFRPFDLPLTDQSGKTVNADQGLKAEEIITMDYLAENVIGYIPTAEELTEDGRSMVMLQGVAGTMEEI